MRIKKSCKAKALNFKISTLNSHLSWKFWFQKCVNSW